MIQCGIVSSAHQLIEISGVVVVVASADRVLRTSACDLEGLLLVRAVVVKGIGLVVAV